MSDQYSMNPLFARPPLFPTEFLLGTIMHRRRRRCLRGLGVPQDERPATVAVRVRVGEHGAGLFVHDEDAARPVRQESMCVCIDVFDLACVWLRLVMWRGNQTRGHAVFKTACVAMIQLVFDGTLLGNFPCQRTLFPI